MKPLDFFRLTLFISGIIIGILMIAFNVHAENIDFNKLADAIKQAENSYNHPYGILKDYCKPGDPDGQCRKGCIQTINKRLKMFNEQDKETDFIVYLSKSYAPIGASNDHGNLNKNWIRNTKYFYNK